MQHFKNILIGIAFSPSLKPNLHEAIRLANMFGSQLIGIHVGDKSPEKDTKLKLILDNAPTLKNELKILWQKGKPVDVILSTIKNQNIDLLILGALQQENLFKYYVGSIARKLTREATCSVLLMIKPSIDRITCKHIVVNGLEDEKTEETIKTAFKVSNDLGCTKITIVEEISQAELDVKVNDDKTLRKANIIKERINTRENKRVKNILKDIDCSNISIKTQSIFGRRGYSIGHYALVKRADLLVMNAPKKLNLLDRIFPHDLEYILSELPTDVLIVK